MARLNEPPLAPAAAAQAGATPPHPEIESYEASESPHTLHFTESTPARSDRDRRSDMRTKSRALMTRGPATADVEEVKRRYIRQNRELAKNNSTQGLRIRGLELDVARLLQANQELRAEVIRCRVEVEQARREGLERWREEMVGKLRELGDWVGRAGGEKEVQEVGKEERKKEVLARFEFRERQSLAEIMRESQMPVIEEARSYPRRTLDAEQVKGLVRLSGSSSGESPDLGPPPVARFEVEEPIKFDARATTVSDETPEAGEPAEEEELPASLSVNLETRRRRKDGQPKLEIRRHSILPPASPSAGEGDVVAPTLRLGAKRKLADRDLDKPVQAPSKTDFTFHRRIPSNEAIKLGEDQPPALQKPVEVPEAIVASPIKASRKVLGEKSVNHSPRKAVPSADKPGQDDDTKKPSALPTPASAAKKDRATSRRSRLSSVPTAQPTTLPTVDIPSPKATKEPSPARTDAPPAAPQPTEPQAPAPLPAEPLFSPTSEPCSLSRDTPPPGLATSLATSGIPGARPSRRARAAVNYAEPSLVAKMRRPSKNLVDAIEGSADAASRRVKNSSGSGKAGDAVVIKIEDEGGAGLEWKGVPERISPWVERSRRKARESGEVRFKVEPGLEEERDAKIAALAPPALADASVLQPAANDELDAAARKLQELDLYDFRETDSSSPAASSTSVPSPEDGETQARSTGGRRHSAVPREGVGLKTAEGGAAVRGSARAAGRRRSMLL